MIPKLKVEAEFSDSINAVLFAHGFRPLGHGFSAEAWAYKGVVYKFMRAEEFGPHKAWFDFVAKRPNKHYPKFKSIGFGWLDANESKFFKEKWYCIKMEELIPLDKKETKIFYQLEFYIGDSTKVFSEEELSKWIGRKNCDFMKAANEAYLRLVNTGFKSDMAGPNNVMKRPDGTWVILDPIRES